MPLQRYSGIEHEWIEEYFSDISLHLLQDVLVFLAFLARLFVRQGLYQRYIFRLGLVWCSCSVHLCALVIVLIYTITKDGWDKFEQQMLHTATKRDIGRRFQHVHTAHCSVPL